MTPPKLELYNFYLIKNLDNNLYTLGYIPNTENDTGIDPSHINYFNMSKNGFISNGYDIIKQGSMLDYASEVINVTDSIHKIFQSFIKSYES